MVIHKSKPWHTGMIVSRGNDPPKALFQYTYYDLSRIIIEYVRKWHVPTSTEHFFSYSGLWGYSVSGLFDFLRPMDISGRHPLVHPSKESTPTKIHKNTIKHCTHKCAKRCFWIPKRVFHWLFPVFQISTRRPQDSPLNHPKIFMVLIWAISIIPWCFCQAGSRLIIWRLGPWKSILLDTYYAGWWFQTWILFSISYMGYYEIILPIDELIFFNMVKTTSMYQPTAQWLTSTDSIGSRLADTLAGLSSDLQGRPLAESTETNFRLAPRKKSLNCEDTPRYFWEKHGQSLPLGLKVSQFSQLRSPPCRWHFSTDRATALFPAVCCSLVRPGVGGWDVHYQRIEGSNPGLREATKRCVVALGHRWGHVVDDLDGLNPPVGPVFGMSITWSNAQRDYTLQLFEIPGCRGVEIR